MKTIQIQKRRRKTMNKKEVEGIEKVIKEYLKKNLRYPGYHISKRGKIYSRWDVN